MFRVGLRSVIVHGGIANTTNRAGAFLGRHLGRESARQLWHPAARIVAKIQKNKEYAIYPVRSRIYPFRGPCSILDTEHAQDECGNYLLVDQESLHPPRWASMGAIENKHLPDLLSLPSTNYGRQTDWFLRHRDTGVKNLAAIPAAESALVGVAVTQKGMPAAFIVALLIGLACAAPLLACLAYRACRQAYRAALESVFMMAKLAWAMGCDQSGGRSKGRE